MMDGLRAIMTAASVTNMTEAYSTFLLLITS